MEQQMNAYFSAEKVESVFFVLAGVAAIAVSIALWRSGAALRGMGVPLVLIGLIQLGVGGAILLRTDKQVAALTEQLRSAPSAYRAAELSRMQTVQKNFGTYKYAEIALLLLGLVGIFALRNRELLYGASIGLILMSAVMLSLDLIAEHRGATYLAAVQSLPA